MRVAGWLEDLAEAMASGDIDDSSSIVALRRNTEAPFRSAETWHVLPVISIERDEDDLDLIVGTPSDTGMTAGDVRDWFAQHPDCGDCELFVPEPWQEVDDEWSVRQDMPAIGPVMNADQSAFGVMVWYEGCEEELA